MYTVRELQQEYRYVNRKHFGGRLPMIRMEWSESIPPDTLAATHPHGVVPCVKKYCGTKCDSSFVRFHPILSLKMMETTLLITLRHEMIHVESLLGNVGLAKHGLVFHGRLRELMDEGAFDGLL